MRIPNAAGREIVINSSFDQGIDRNGRYIFPAIAVRYPNLFDGRTHLARSSQFPRPTFRRRAIGMTIRSCGIELYRARALYRVGRILGFHFSVDWASASSAGNECHTYGSQDLLRSISLGFFLQGCGGISSESTGARSQGELVTRYFPRAGKSRSSSSTASAPRPPKFLILLCIP